MTDLCCSEASSSPDGEYRYWLGRRWDHSRRRVLWIMLNPSTADATVDDPTIRRCIGFARKWGYGGISVVNLFALRATNPTALTAHPDPVGDENDVTIQEWLMSDVFAVAAWGVQGRFCRRDAEVRTIAARVGRPLHVLGLTKEGHPKHPLYVRGETQPEMWQL